MTSLRSIAIVAAIALVHYHGHDARGDLQADSPVKFPKEGALPPKYLPDRPAKDDREIEPGTYLSSSPLRSLEQVRTIQRDMPAGRFTPAPHDWSHLPRTHRILKEGGTLRLVGLGDSIINDTMRSAWVALLRDAYPKAEIRATTLVRGGGSCEYYKEAGRIEKYLGPLKPDLVIIGGISQKSIESIHAAISQLRAISPDVEILLTTGAFGPYDPRDLAELARADYAGSGKYGKALRQLAADDRCAFLDITTPWAEYIRSSGIHPHLFYRDVVHANEFGEQILAKIMMAFFRDETGDSANKDPLHEK